MAATESDAASSSNSTDSSVHEDSDARSQKAPPAAERPKPKEQLPIKEEICRLRAEVKTLTAELRALGGLPPSGNQSEEKAASRSQLWRQIAAKQLERRHRAEEENAMLRNMVELQTEEARNLRRILKRRTKIQMMEKLLGKKAQQKQQALPRATPATSEDSSHVFNQILQDIDQTYADVDTLIKEMDTYNIPCPGRHRRATDNTVNGVCLELMERFVVPFSVDATAKAFWDALDKLECQEMQCVDDLKVDIQWQMQSSEKGKDTVMVNFNSTYSVDSFIWRSKVRKVVRKYVNDNATVLIYRAFIEPKLLGMNESIGVFWTSTLLVDIRQDAMSSGEIATFVRGYFYATRRDEGMAVAEKLRSPSNLKMAMAVWDESIPRLYRQVESLLVDEAIKQPFNTGSSGQSLPASAAEGYASMDIV
ncbi:hypothetical protein PHYBOEH_012039 [Phytophthora boehmeriae]|uniref:M96 mating-specific protein family n=1 Tax=Phytophthora boehmeriae TaxID=109152 RepID=A0A8T1VFY5_9STRA|nr:hypothetical protein PHYBOEH_012039 [Phytophthora boehmeriae]